MRPTNTLQQERHSAVTPMIRTVRIVSVWSPKLATLMSP